MNLHKLTRKSLWFASNVKSCNLQSNAIPHSHGPHSPWTCFRSYGTALTPSQPTKLEKIIRDTIKASGPMSVSTYMQLCLSHPVEGYYMKSTNPVFGERGDFTTSPEISQVFGELLGIWHVGRWEEAGRPSKIRVVELGPGRGTLMADMLRAMSQISDCRGAIHSVHLVETSNKMRKLQSAKLTSSTGKRPSSWSVSWHDSIEELLEKAEGAFTMLIAHEFFDALPVHVLQKDSNGWKEVLVTCNPDPTAKTIISAPQTLLSDGISETRLPSFQLVRSPSPTATSQLLSSSSPRFAALPIGARLEVSPLTFKIARQVAELISVQGGSGGSALIIDYGDDKAFGNSLRAFKDHKIVDIFNQPGECDLTANVDFAYVKEAMIGAAKTYGPCSQSTFLRRMGLHLRVNVLKRAAESEERKTEIEKAAERLIDLNGMGKEYQVLGVTSSENLGKEVNVWPFLDPGYPTGDTE